MLKISVFTLVFINKCTVAYKSTQSHIYKTKGKKFS